MKKRYRIVRDSYAGYEAQAWSWWFPFWRQINFSNTHTSIERATEMISKYSQSGRVVKDLGWL